MLQEPILHRLLWMYNIEPYCIHAVSNKTLWCDVTHDWAGLSVAPFFFAVDMQIWRAYLCLCIFSHLLQSEEDLLSALSLSPFTVSLSLSLSPWKPQRTRLFQSENEGVLNPKAPKPDGIYSLNTITLHGAAALITLLFSSFFCHCCLLCNIG